MYFTCSGYWRDSRGIRHNFEIESDRAERSFYQGTCGGKVSC